MKTLLFLCLWSSTLAYSQNRDNNWFFGSLLGMQFSGSGMSIIPAGTSPIYSPYAAASYSDPLTGALMFYTNGSIVYNRNHQMMPNGDFINGDALAIHCYIVPHPGNPDQYFILSSSPQGNTLYYALVDMRMNGGLGGVVSKINPVTNRADKAFTIVKNLYDEEYWLITHVYGTNQFLSFRIGKNGIESTGVSSVAGDVMPGGDGFEFIRGKMVSNSTGTQFAFSNGTNEGYFLQLYSFDKKCGTVGFKADLQPDILQAYAPLAYPAFSPDDKILYGAWFYEGSQNFLYQYNLTAPDPNASRVTIHSQELVLGDMQVGPDGKIYMTAAKDAAVTSRVSVINKPNVAGMGCDFRLYEYILSNNPAHFTEHFIEYIRDVSVQLKGYAKPKMVFANTCQGQPVSFSVADSFLADSFRWHFGDGNTSTQKKPVHQYADLKDYPVRFEWYLCNRKYETSDTVKLRRKPVIDLGGDSVSCAGKSILLAAPIGADEYLWSTGESGSFIQVNAPGLYGVKVRSGNCWGEDEINIAFHPDIFTKLGSDYFICEDDKELVKLDAGEGFINYKWTPTEDTTQWIMVKNTGEYFVKVTDHFGCPGNDDTRVKRRCGVLLYFPNIFTPNKDGLNDAYLPLGNDVTEFNILIYNRWGELVFKSEQLARGWDGTVNEKPAIDGIYVYQAEYKGYKNKRLQTFYSKGNITLMR